MNKVDIAIKSIGIIRPADLSNESFVFQWKPETSDASRIKIEQPPLAHSPEQEPRQSCLANSERGRS